MRSNVATDRGPQELYGKLNSLVWRHMKPGAAIYTYEHHAHQPEGKWAQAKPGRNYEECHCGADPSPNSWIYDKLEKIGPTKADGLAVNSCSIIKQLNRTYIKRP